LRYKFEIYQKNFPIFIYGNLTSIEVLGYDEETEVGPSGTIQEKEVQTEESQDLKSGATQKKMYRKKNHRTLEEGSRIKGTTKNKDMWRLFQQKKKIYLRYNIWKYNHILR
jgi:hypothetical protein